MMLNMCTCAFKPLFLHDLVLLFFCLRETAIRIHYQVVRLVLLQPRYVEDGPQVVLAHEADADGGGAGGLKGVRKRKKCFLSNILYACKMPPKMEC